MLQNIFSHMKKKILIDTNTKIGTEITDIIVFRKKLLKFLQGDDVGATNSVKNVKCRNEMCVPTRNIN